MTKKTASDPLSDYPQTAELKSGTAITLKAMHADDRCAIMEFAKQLPEEDLLFLTIDLTQKNQSMGGLPT